MKSFDELNYYEMLKIPVNSPSFEIKRAYKDALAIYDEDSLATYNLFSNDERDKMLEVIEEAFLTLIDASKRAAYDRMLTDSGQVDAAIVARKNQKEPTSFLHTNIIVEKESLVKRVRKKSKEEEVKKLINEILAKDLIAGNDLKKLRKAIGVEISEINAVAKISVSILKSIEENQFEDLPPKFYLLNFLKFYAEILQIDSQRIVDGYLKNISFVQQS
jgi:DNA-binding transcriptional regulator YiaG